MLTTCRSWGAGNKRDIEGKRKEKGKYRKMNAGRSEGKEGEDRDRKE